MQRKKGIRVVEFGVLIGVLVASGLFSLPAVKLARDLRASRTCQANLREWGVAIRLFATEHSGRYPGRFIDYMKPYTPALGFWSEIDYTEVWPEYARDIRIMICPAFAIEPPAGWNEVAKGYGYPESVSYRRAVDPSWEDDPLDSPGRRLARGMRDQKITQAQADPWCRDTSLENDQHCYWRPSVASYTYWGWLVQGIQVSTTNDMYEMSRVLDNDVDDPSRDNPGANSAYRFKDIDLLLPDFGKTTVHYFREGVERFQITDTNHSAAATASTADLALMWDKPEDSLDIMDPLPKKRPHRNNALNVLFMDGHVESALYPQPNGGRFWMLSEAAVFDHTMWFP